MLLQTGQPEKKNVNLNGLFFISEKDRLFEIDIYSFVILRYPFKDRR